MKIKELIATFGYEGGAELTASLLPSVKYGGMTLAAVLINSASSLIVALFGLNAWAFGALMAVLGFELITGLRRASVEKEVITSAKFSRFSFKFFYYLILISITWLMHANFKAQGDHLAAVIFDYMHMFITIQIVLENVVSISENVAVITGKPKAHWIGRLQKKVNNLFNDH